MKPEKNGRAGLMNINPSLININPSLITLQERKGGPFLTCDISYAGVDLGLATTREFNARDAPHLLAVEFQKRLDRMSAHERLEFWRKAQASQ